MTSWVHWDAVEVLHLTSTEAEFQPEYSLLFPSETEEVNYPCLAAGTRCHQKKEK